MTKHNLFFSSAACLLMTALLLVGAGCGSSKESARSSSMDAANIIATYGNETLTLAEFENHYTRTVGNRAMAMEDSVAEYQDFLQRYVDFRLKVKEGVRAGYSTDPEILNEINSYRTSFAKPYLLDKTVLEPIIQDLYERSKEMVSASHILLRVPQDAPPADTLTAYNKIVALRDSAMQGVPFGDLAFRHSEDPSASREGGGPGFRGDLGFFTAGRMVEEFENEAYTTPVGEVSEPFRTQFGYHILHVKDRQPVIPNVTVAHIMVRLAGNAPEDSAEAIQKIEAIQDRLESGEAFPQVAQTSSEDANSARNGGVLGTLRYDDYRVDAAFKDAAFGLEELNTPSEIVETQYGYHILMLTDRDELGTLEEEYDSLKKTAANLPRTKRAEDQLTADIRTRYASMIDSTALRSLVATQHSDSVIILLSTSSFSEAELNQPIASLGDSTFTLGDLTAYLKNNRVTMMPTADEQLWTAVDDLIDQHALDYEAAQLEQRDAEFGRIMAEFRDGLVLFRLMEDSVWTAATQDSLALQAHYNAHREAYQFPKRTRVIEVYSKADTVLTSIAAQLAGGTSLESFVAEIDEATSRYVNIDTLLVEDATNSVYDQAIVLDEGEHTAVLQHRTGHVILFNAGTVAPRPKTFEEARTEVANDYQQVLEDRLLARLRKDYNVRTYPERLSAAFQEMTSTASGTTDAME